MIGSGRVDRGEDEGERNVAIVEVAAVEYREALRAVREMLERAGSAAAVDAGELRARRAAVLAVAARGAARGIALSPDMTSLLERLANEPVEVEGGAPASAAA